MSDIVIPDSQSDGSFGALDASQDYAQKRLTALSFHLLYQPQRQNWVMGWDVVVDNLLPCRLPHVLKQSLAKHRRTSFQAMRFPRHIMNYGVAALFIL